MKTEFESILLYLETCCVDQIGRVEAKRLNEQDYDDIEQLKSMGMVKEFKKIKFHKVEELKKDIPEKSYTHTVDLTDEGWKHAHIYRKDRGKRMMAKRS